MCSLKVSQIRANQVLLSFLMCFFLPALSHADLTQPVTDVSELTSPKSEIVLRVQGARIILADYPLIRRDFPRIRLKSGQVVETRHLSESEIDAWLLEKTGYVSKAQAYQSRVNTRIKIASDSTGEPITTTAYRPQLYGRALVFEADQGLIDVKGVGTRDAPRVMSHGTGLASLGEVIREFILHKKVQQILDHSGSGYRTVGSYAVIDWGFDGAEPNGNFVRAGAILRQAHSRKLIKGVHSGNHFAGIVPSKIIEDILRHYGMTSTGDSESEPFERVNIQVAATGELVDFGTFLVKEQFSKPLVQFTSTAHMDRPGSDWFVQPDRRIRLPLNVFGSSETGRESPRYDNLWIWSHRLAEGLKTGQAQREHAELHLHNMMQAGSPPQELAGLFEHVKTEHFKKQTIVGMMKSLPINEPPSLDLLEEYLKSTADHGFDKGLLADMMTEKKLGNLYPLAYLELLERHHVFDRFPELSDQLALNSNFQGPESLQLLFKHKRFDAIDAAIKSHRVWSGGIGMFLSSKPALSSPTWPHWVALNMQYDYADFARRYLRDEPMTGRFPELFIKLLEIDSGPAMIQALNRPHWKAHPELVDRAIESIHLKIKDKNTRKSLIDSLLASEIWRLHPRQEVWQKLASRGSTKQCHVLFESIL